MRKPTTVGRPVKRGGRVHRQSTWAVATVLLIAAGLVSSMLAAGAVGRHEDEKANLSFQGTSADVASTLELAIQHEDDLVVDAGGFLADPDFSQSQFLGWANAARVLERYPEISGVAVIVMVQDADLAKFAAQAEADPLEFAPDGPYTVLPQGRRPFYCLVQAGIGRSAAEAPPVGVDSCADPASLRGLMAARDSGQGVYIPFPLNGKTSLLVVTPIYVGDATPTTVEARRAAFAGWVPTPLDPTVLLKRAVRDQPGVSVAMSYAAPPPTPGSPSADSPAGVTFRSGKPAAGAESSVIDLRNGWTVTTFAVVDAGGITQGSALWLLLAGIALSVLLGILMFVLGTGRERARRQLAQRTGQLRHQALHDALTGLPNRALVMDRVEQMLTRDRRHRTSSALLFLDLDDFKNVNDTLGHGAGDRLLIAVAERMSGSLRGVDTLGRMGGDEFVVLVDGATLDVAPELVAERLLDVMAQPFELDESSMPLSVNVSIGIATGDRASADDLLRDADVALYQAKGAGKNRYVTFDPQMETDIGRRSELEFDLRSALTGGQYRLVYQPIYNLDNLSIVGVEALLRWDNPTRGLISPDEFIPILEQTGQIREVGRWVLREACQQMATWHSRGDTVDVSVNVSARQLDSDGVTEDIRVALLESGLPASALIIEVTETALMENVGATARRLQAIKDLGVRIAVDDFGTGYSSLAYLQQFPVDCLKIDRAFTSAVTTSPESRALVNTLVQLGKDLGLSTLAEGVETTREMDLLRDADVNQAQGFLMAHPLDPEALETQVLEPSRPTTPSPQVPLS